MIIGIPKEVKIFEQRVAITPAGVVTLVNHGHQILIEKDAGLGSGFSNEDYEAVGAKIVSTASEAWSADMVMKVKEPIAEEYTYFRENLILFTYLHLAAERELTHSLVTNKVASLAYETVQLKDHSLPLLTPMSEVAGRMATQIGAQFLANSNGGKGILLAGVPGVKRGRVTVIGGGVVGMNAATIAVGLGAEVSIIDVNASRLRELNNIFGHTLTTLMSNPYTIKEEVAKSDLVIGAVLIPGAKAPTLVTEEMVKEMTPGSVIIDVAIDQGGIVETADHVTTHDNPTYTKHGVIHYAVGNMPGAVAKTSTIALTNVTLPYAVQIANRGLEAAIEQDEALAKGLNTYNGHITYKNVADAHGLAFTPYKNLIKTAFV
jgi:alanine dehydrogenase